MFGIQVGDVVAASLAAAVACLVCSIPRDFVVHLLRKFPGWVLRTYGKRALLAPVLALLVATRIWLLAIDGKFDTTAGLAMIVAASCLGLLFASALMRFYFSDYRKSR